MKQMLLLMIISIFALNSEISAGELKNHPGIEEAIVQETEKIAATHAADHDELSQLYAFRGELYLLHSEYQKALDDFQETYSHSRRAKDEPTALFSAFRALFGAVICYDNLGLHEASQEALLQLESMAGHILCKDCMEPSSNPRTLKTSHDALNYRNLIVTCANENNFDDIIGPDRVSFSWFTDMVQSLVDSMTAIIKKAPDRRTRDLLTDNMKELESEAYGCYRRGGFWKRCIAPLAREWQQWKDFYIRYGYPRPPRL